MASAEQHYFDDFEPEVPDFKKLRNAKVSFLHTSTAKSHLGDLKNSLQEVPAKFCEMGLVTLCQPRVLKTETQACLSERALTTNQRVGLIQKLGIPERNSQKDLMDADILNNLNLDSPNMHPAKARPGLFEMVEENIRLANAKIARMEDQGHTDDPHILYDHYKKLRIELKRLNQHLNLLIESKNSLEILSRKSKQARQQEQPEDVLIRYRDSEITNCQKILKNLVHEYDRLYSRMEEVKDPSYLVKLQDDDEALDEHIKRLEKMKKDLQFEQLKREKVMDKMIASGPDDQKSINEYTAEVAVVQKKIASLEYEKEQAQERDKQQAAYKRELQEKEKRYLKEAAERGFNLENEIFKLTNPSEKKSREEKKEQRRILEDRLRVAKNALESIDKRELRRVKELKTRYKLLRKKLHDQLHSVGEIETQGVQQRYRELDGQREEILQCKEILQAMSEIQSSSRKPQTEESKLTSVSRPDLDSIIKSPSHNEILKKLAGAQEAAAVVIQKNARMFLAKKQVKKMKKESARKMMTPSQTSEKRTKPPLKPSGKYGGVLPRV